MKAGSICTRETKTTEDRRITCIGKANTSNKGKIQTKKLKRRGNRRRRKIRIKTKKEILKKNKRKWLRVITQGNE